MVARHNRMDHQGFAPVLIDSTDIGVDWKGFECAKRSYHGVRRYQDAYGFCGESYGKLTFERQQMPCDARLARVVRCGCVVATIERG